MPSSFSSSFSSSSSLSSIGHNSTDHNHPVKRGVPGIHNHLTAAAALILLLVCSLPGSIAASHECLNGSGANCDLPPRLQPSPSIKAQDLPWKRDSSGHVTRTASLATPSTRVTHPTASSSTQWHKKQSPQHQQQQQQQQQPKRQTGARPHSQEPGQPAKMLPQIIGQGQRVRPDDDSEFWSLSSLASPSNRPSLHQSQAAPSPQPQQAVDGGGMVALPLDTIGALANTRASPIVDLSGSRPGGDIANPDPQRQQTPAVDLVSVDGIASNGGNPLDSPAGAGSTIGGSGSSDSNVADSGPIVLGDGYIAIDSEPLLSSASASASPSATSSLSASHSTAASFSASVLRALPNGSLIQSTSVTPLVLNDQQSSVGSGGSGGSGGGSPSARINGASSSLYIHLYFQYLLSFVAILFAIVHVL
ncbi:hypothetical protein GQ42DRAFT_153954 [Ramicandelaber brevisporus]|nr:hypothetical protein GQ42DRAFT_153954 [Ramicandelaber brevisporus]